MTQTLLLLPGDGIGPEVIAEAVRIAELVAPDIALEEGLVGGASLDAHGVPLTDDTLARARICDAVLLGANSTVLPTIRVGDRAMIGAGSVVTQNVDHDVRAFGNPARPR